MGQTWDPPGSCRPQLGPMLAPWTLLSGKQEDGRASPPSMALTCSQCIPVIFKCLNNTLILYGTWLIAFLTFFTLCILATYHNLILFNFWFAILYHSQIWQWKPNLDLINLTCTKFTYMSSILFCHSSYCRNVIKPVLTVFCMIFLSLWGGDVF